MIHKNCAAVIPAPGPFTEADQAMLAQADGLLKLVRAEFDRIAFHRALDAIWAVIAAANVYVDEQAPWALRRTDPARMGTVLYVLAEVVRQTAILTQPILPGASGRVLDQVSVPAGARDFAQLGQGGRLAAGAAIPKPEGVFPRFVEDAA